MAPSPAILHQELKKIDKILFLGSDLVQLARLVTRFQDAEILHAQEHVAKDEMEKFDPDLVVCTAESFRCVLTPPRKSMARPHLTPRQQELVALVTKGLSNREIASVLRISARAVKGEVSALLMLFEASNRTELAVIAADVEAA